MREILMHTNVGLASSFFYSFWKDTNIKFLLLPLFFSLDVFVRCFFYCLCLRYVFASSTARFRLRTFCVCRQFYVFVCFKVLACCVPVAARILSVSEAREELVGSASPSLLHASSAVVLQVVPPRPSSLVASSSESRRGLRFFCSCLLCGSMLFGPFFGRRAI